MEEDMSSAAGVPAVSSSPSVIMALAAYEIERISVVTPYVAWANNRLKTYFEAHAVRVMSIAGHPRFSDDDHPQHMNDQDPDEIATFAISQCDPRAEAIFCSCSGWRAMEAAHHIEAETGRLVLTTNMATVWRTLQVVGVREATKGIGQLLDDMPPVPLIRQTDAIGGARYGTG
jgi:maleate cis-trans isomerase